MAERGSVGGNAEGSVSGREGENKRGSGRGRKRGLEAFRKEVGSHSWLERSHSRKRGCRNLSSGATMLSPLWV